MRMLLPGKRLRRQVDDALHAFFSDGQNADFEKAVSLLCTFYKVKSPKIEWYEYLGRGKLMGQTVEDGQINLIAPEHWRARKVGTDRLWVRVFYHEFAHFLFWSDAEEKADRYMRLFCVGLRPD
jgi:hypothetical protein